VRFVRDLRPAGRAALGALALALALLGAAVRGAVRIDPLPDSVTAAAPATIPDPIRSPAPAAQAVLAAVERDPFSPDRRPPADRYRMPGEAPAAATARGTGAPVIQLHGVVLLPSGGGMAALYAAGRSAQVVRVGQTFEGYRLVRVGPGEAVLEGPDDTLTLRFRGR
jgi:hypothetical protein